ncbi:MAG: hypothetical protein FWF51_03535 [Chitinivibrionia bacterium]|nr:hypothetical protein [Chitinivibrionia bacterium]
MNMDSTELKSELKKAFKEVFNQYQDFWEFYRPEILTYWLHNANKIVSTDKKTGAIGNCYAYAIEPIRFIEERLLNDLREFMKSEFSDGIDNIIEEYNPS